MNKGTYVDDITMVGKKKRVEAQGKAVKKCDEKTASKMVAEATSGLESGGLLDYGAMKDHLCHSMLEICTSEIVRSIALLSINHSSHRVEFDRPSAPIALCSMSQRPPAGLCDDSVDETCRVRQGL